MEDTIANSIASIIPFDSIEKNHIDSSIRWVKSGKEICRIKKPDVPKKHLVAYFVPVDKKTKKLILINHLKSGLWLPPGGHVEKNENPINTVKREMQEELHSIAKFISKTPFFITVTKTINIDAGHTDVSLWYLVIGDSSIKYTYNKKEMSGYRWFTSNEILKSKKINYDPHMKRFVKKLLQTT